MPIIKNARFQQRRNTTEYWRLHPHFIPLDGEIVVYTDYSVVDGKTIPGIKIGDGKTYIVDLPFLVEGSLTTHINNASIHVSEEDRNFWNNKLNYYMEGETLVFTRN